MATTITVRNVPDEVRDELAARAARSGRSLQEYVRATLIATVEKPDAADWVARVRARKEATGATTLDAATILAARDADRR